MELLPIKAATAHVRLAPLEAAHAKGLRAAASDDALWAWWPRGNMGANFDRDFAWQLAEHAAKRWIIHTVITPDGEIVGQTCFLNIRPEHQGVEIGGTWYARSAQGAGVNPGAKLLMLENAFACGAERVELKTDALNARSRAAILKLGAQFEGVFRRHMRYPDGRWRDTAWYSVLRKEWPEVRARLEARLAQINPHADDIA